ncbi:MAG: hypothetical protein KatS3mg059_0461 [Thermomicrobiales bacterium]|nr:MAG: hypothetical protein KatS3mg059_0461 [Thermomicrobiales bacterium]
MIVREVSFGRPPWAALNGDNIQPRRGQLLGQNTAGPASADGDNVNFRKLLPSPASYASCMPAKIGQALRLSSGPIRVTQFVRGIGALSPGVADHLPANHVAVAGRT